MRCRHPSVDPHHLHHRRGIMAMMKLDRRINILALILFLMLTYVMNTLWYASNFAPEMPRRPNPNWTRYFREAYNMSLLNETTDFNTLVDLPHFRFLINNRRCDDRPDDLFLVIFIHSAPTNFHKRKAIRETWGRESNLQQEDGVRVVFMLGEVEDRAIQNALEAENHLYHDLVQGTFIDHYRNLTYKHVMGLKWVTYFCRQAKFVFKTDDDIFVDIFQLTSYLKGSQEFTAPRDLMMCFLIQNSNVKRSQWSKWKVSYQEYPHRYYPTYCSGWGIVMSPDVVFNLYLQSSKVPFFWVDDVHVSGILAKRIGITHVDFTPKLDITEEDVQRWLSEKKLVRPHLFGHPDADVETIYTLWNKTVQFYEWTKSHR